MANCPKDWVDILSALATPTLALFAVYVAWRQWRTADLKRQHELFDRRYEIYEQVSDCYTSIIENSPVLDQKIYNLRYIRKRARFLFSQEVSDYIEEIAFNGAGLSSLYYKINMQNSRSSEDDENMGKLFSNHTQLCQKIDLVFEKFLAIKEK